MPALAPMALGDAGRRHEDRGGVENYFAASPLETTPITSTLYNYNITIAPQPQRFPVFTLSTTSGHRACNTATQPHYYSFNKLAETISVAICISDTSHSPALDQNKLRRDEQEQVQVAGFQQSCRINLWFGWRIWRLWLWADGQHIVLSRRATEPHKHLGRQCCGRVQESAEEG